MPKVPSDPPKVAIVGRPNVGKSSLFNRIIKRRRTIVYREQGTTRDRVSEVTAFMGRGFVLTDTGGFTAEDKIQLLKLVKGQIKKAIEEADTLLFVCDGQQGPVPEDFELTSVLRKSNKKIFLVVNKADNQKMEEGATAFYQLGMGRPYLISALHNIGIDELLRDVVNEFPEEAHLEKKAEPIKVAIVGRPNVGKSSLLNCLLKEERVIVDEAPGTTRDIIDTYLKDGETEFVLVDTAGIRHRKKVKEAVDVYSIMRTKEAVRRSEVCLVLIDAYDGLVVDDLRILELVLGEGKGCILCVNKWDLIKNLPPSKYKEMIYKRAKFLKKYPVVFTSTRTKYNVYNSLTLVREVINNSTIKVPTSQLNKLLSSFRSRGPFSSKRNRLRLNYITQTAVRPPTFLVFANDPRAVLDEHKNFIENLLRRNFGFFGAPIKLQFRGSKEAEV